MPGRIVFRLSDVIADPPEDLALGRVREKNKKGHYHVREVVRIHGSTPDDFSRFILEVFLDPFRIDFVVNHFARPLFCRLV